MPCPNDAIFFLFYVRLCTSHAHNETERQKEKARKRLDGIFCLRTTANGRRAASMSNVVVAERWFERQQTPNGEQKMQNILNKNRAMSHSFLLLFVLNKFASHVLVHVLLSDYCCLRTVGTLFPFQHQEHQEHSMQTGNGDSARSTSAYAESFEIGSEHGKRERMNSKCDGRVFIWLHKKRIKTDEFN